MDLPSPGPDRDPHGRDARLERLLGSVEDGLWEHDLVRGDVRWSRRFRHLLGFAADEWPPDPSVLRLRLHPDALAAYDAMHAQAGRGEMPESRPMRLLCRDGRWRWFRVRMRAWPDAHGRPTHLVGTLRDIDAEMRTTTELQAVRERFEGTLTASDEGHFDATWDVDVVSMSERARELVGLPPGTRTASYDALRARVHADDREPVRQAVAKAVAEIGGGRWQVTYRAERFDRPGDWRWFRERGAIRTDADGALRAWGLLADITEQTTETERLETRVARRTAELAEALRLAEDRRQAAEAANRAKASFLGQMSHELRTPLNGVLGMLQLAERTPASAEQARFLSLARQSAGSMLHVVEDLLEFARAEAGRLVLDLQPFDLARLVADACAAFMPAARTRGLELLYDHVGSVTRVVGDASRLQQMVSNLIGNATKFTERGRITVTVETRPSPPGAPGTVAVRITVADTGPGMDAETARRVFEPFEQGDATIGRRHGGAGLGLSIVRMLAERMDGRVELDTRPGAGCTFRLLLSLAPDTTDPIDSTSTATAPPPSGLAWVLHARESTGAWVAGRIARLGWDTAVHTGLEAAVQAAARSAAPQAVVIGEPLVGDGSSLVALRAVLPPACACTVLLRPDYQGEPVLARVRSLGFRIAFAPLVPQAIADCLRPTPAAAPDAAAHPVAARPGPVVRSRVLVVEDNPVNRLIAREMLAALGVDCDEADGGEAALAACLREPPDLVLMDVQMPGLDGLQTCARLRALQREGRLRRFPVIALTAHALPGDREASLAAGMDDHLTKPIRIDALREALQRHLDGRLHARTPSSP